MTEWVESIDVREQFKAVQLGQLTVKDLNASLIEQIERLQQYTTDMDLRDLCDAFRRLNANEQIDVAQFDSVFANLYEWANDTIGESDSIFDQKKKCWVKAMM